MPPTNQSVNIVFIIFNERFYYYLYTCINDYNIDSYYAEVETSNN